MIGVILGETPRWVVEEFFQLFKTPWEVYREGAKYDCVIAPLAEAVATEAKLLILWGPDPDGFDGRLGVTQTGSHQRAVMNYAGRSVPIYAGLLAFDAAVPVKLILPSNCGAAGYEIATKRLVRLGYSFFQEIEFLLRFGQPVSQAAVPTLEIHIQMLREWFHAAGMSFVEIPPRPFGHPFSVCLTHDIDFVGIQNHRWDATAWGFLYRSTLGALLGACKGRITLGRLFKSWAAAVSLPLVYLGWMRDFWLPFPWYLNAERQLPVTYFLIPFKNRPGLPLGGRDSSRRACAYDVSDMADWIKILLAHGCEIGVHGIDSWNDAELGRLELARVRAFCPGPVAGIRMHWLFHHAETPRLLEQAGYTYDSTFGYNETPGYLNGTTQVFSTEGARHLLELPMHIQDGALFYPTRRGLNEVQAWTLCQELIDNSREFGGVLTLIWHDRSHGPERFWGGFYLRLLERLKALGVRFFTAGEMVNWFARRRSLQFVLHPDVAGNPGIELRYEGPAIEPPLIVRTYCPSGTDSLADQVSLSAPAYSEISWDGTSSLEISGTRPVIIKQAPAS
jgi:hypothetical protein